jgi:hypothetical protein
MLRRVMPPSKLVCESHSTGHLPRVEILVCSLRASSAPTLDALCWQLAAAAENHMPNANLPPQGEWSQLLGEWSSRPR